MSHGVAASIQENATLPFPAADIEVTKDGSLDDCNPGPPVDLCRVIWTITVTNHGPVAVTGLTIQEQPQAPATVLTSPAPAMNRGTYDPLTNVWTIGDLAEGDTAVLQIATDLSGQEADNCATVLHLDQVDLVPGNNSDCGHVGFSSEQTPLDPGGDLARTTPSTLRLADLRPGRRQ